MRGENAGSSEKKKIRDPDFITAEAAMQRAAQKAREKAGRTGAGVIVLKDGGIVEERPEPPAR
jgi:hypothetical protein